MFSGFLICFSFLALLKVTWIFFYSCLMYSVLSVSHFILLQWLIWFLQYTYTTYISLLMSTFSLNLKNKGVFGISKWDRCYFNFLGYKQRFMTFIFLFDDNTFNQKITPYVTIQMFTYSLYNIIIQGFHSWFHVWYKESPIY